MVRYECRIYTVTSKHPNSSHLKDGGTIYYKRASRHSCRYRRMSIVNTHQSKGESILGDIPLTTKTQVCKSGVATPNLYIGNRPLRGRIRGYCFRPLFGIGSYAIHFVTRSHRVTLPPPKPLPVVRVFRYTI